MSSNGDERSIRRAQALDAARQLLSQGGFGSLSMRKLASAAGMAVNTVYALFGSRDGIVEALVADAVARSEGAARARLDAMGSPLEAITALLHGSLQQAIAGAEYMRPMFQALRHMPSLRDKGLPRSLEVTTTLFRAAQEASLLRDDVDVRLLAGMLLRSFYDAGTAWAADEIDDERFQATSLHVLAVLLVAAATTDTEPRLRDQLREAEARLRLSRGEPPP